VCAYEKYEDEDRLLQEIDRKNKEIHDLSNNTTKDIDGAWTSAYDRVKQSREKHTGLLRSIDKSTRTKIYGFDNLIHDGKEDMRQLLKQQAELEYELSRKLQSVPNIHKGSRIKRPFGQLNSMLVQFGNV
jgi:DNA repair exonuclease SbcCD ATPase subunit